MLRRGQRRVRPCSHSAPPCKQQRWPSVNVFLWMVALPPGCNWVPGCVFWAEVATSAAGSTQMCADVLFSYLEPILCGLDTSLLFCCSALLTRTWCTSVLCTLPYRKPGVYGSISLLYWLLFYVYEMENILKKLF